jgi:hypothetical protein
VGLPLLDHPCEEQLQPHVQGLQVSPPLLTAPLLPPALQQKADPAGDTGGWTWMPSMPGAPGSAHNPALTMKSPRNSVILHFQQPGGIDCRKTVFFEMVFFFFFFSLK